MLSAFYMVYFVERKGFYILFKKTFYEPHLVHGLCVLVYIENRKQILEVYLPSIQRDWGICSKNVHTEEQRTMKQKFQR